MDGSTEKVVVEYLSCWDDDVEATYLAEPMERQTSADAAVLLEATTRGGRDVGAAKLRFGEPLAIEVLWEVRRPCPGTMCFIRIFDRQERLVFSVNTETTPIEFETVGRYRLTCRFDHNPLVPGVYSVAVGCFAKPKRMVHLVERCLSFEILASPYDGKLPSLHARAVVAVPATWEERTGDADYPGESPT